VDGCLDLAEPARSYPGHRAGSPRPEQYRYQERWREVRDEAKYARENGSFGLTTLRSSHGEVVGSLIVFRFRGKRGKDHEVDVHDRRLARVVARLEQLPGQELFQYRDDDGELRPIGSDDVNAYLREISGEDMTAKEFRT
jgi:DNA topoisomerase-1